MSTRIRYRENAEGVLVSTRVINTDHGDILIKIFKSDRNVMLIRATDNVVLHSFVGTNDHAIKKLIKSKLEEMGAKFNNEKRTRNKTNTVSL